jgi:hypothetical protein
MTFCNDELTPSVNGLLFGYCCKFVLIKLGEIMGGWVIQFYSTLSSLGKCVPIFDLLYRSHTNTTDYLRVGTVLCQSRINVY